MDEPGKVRVRKTKAERQREIAEATFRLVGKYGVQGTTVPRIAAAVGLSRGALYRHFRNREAVLLAAVDVMHERVWEWIDRSSGPDAYQRLVDMGVGHASWASAEYETFIRPVFEFIASGGPGNLRRPLAESQLEILNGIIAIVEEGKRRGSIRKDVESGDVAWALLMVAWSEDIARLLGVDQFITDGASTRNFMRMLAGVAAGPSVVEE